MNEPERIQVLISTFSDHSAIAENKAATGAHLASSILNFLLAHSVNPRDIRNQPMFGEDDSSIKLIGRLGAEYLREFEA